MNWRKLTLAFLLFSPMAVAQFTQVQGTVIDPQGRPYSNGTIMPTLIISGTPLFASSHLPYQPPTTPTGLDKNGFFIMQLADVTQLLPTGGLWSFQVCSSTSNPPPPPTGPICFTTVGLIIMGTVQDISTVLQADAPLLGPPSGGGGSGTVSSGTGGQFAVYTGGTGSTTVASTPRLVDNTTSLTATVPFTGTTFTANRFQATPTSGCGSVLFAAAPNIQTGFNITSAPANTMQICQTGVELARIAPFGGGGFAGLSLAGGSPGFIDFTAGAIGNPAIVRMQANISNDLGVLSLSSPDLDQAGVQMQEGPFADLAACTAGTDGTITPITDSTSSAVGQVVSTGGGTNHVLLYCNGTNWIVHSGAGAATGVFVIANFCNGQLNCLQWNDDDVTDNCGAATTNFFASINAYAGPGVPQLSILGSSSGKAYKLATAGCNLTFLIPATIHLRATLDCAQPAPTPNCIQFGPAGQSALSSNHIFKFQIDGGGHLVGGANLTNAGIEIEPYMANALITTLNFENFGAGNATLGSCTNYAILMDNGVAESTISYNHWQITDTTSGRCAFGVPSGSVLGTNTAFFIGNTLGGENLAANTCSSTGIFDGGSYGRIVLNNIYGFGVPIRVAGLGHIIENQNIDNAGCSANGVNGAIHFGATGSSASVGPMQITHNTIQFGTGHVTGFMLVLAGDSTAGLHDVVATNNMAVIPAGTVGAFIATNVPCIGTGGQAGTSCYNAFNTGMSGALHCEDNSSYIGWTYGNIFAGCSDSGLTANINVGTKQLIGTTFPRVTTTVSFTCQVLLTTAATTSSTLPACGITYTDVFTNTVQTVTVTPPWASGTIGCAGTTTNTVGNACSGTLSGVAIKAGTQVTYFTGNYASAGATPMQYQVFVRATVN